MRFPRSSGLAVVIVSLGLIGAACGADSGIVGSTASAAAEGSRPTVVVTTNILGDVVSNVLGDEVEVVTIMPVGSDPHEFQPSAQQAAQIDDADALIVNGGGFEEGLLDVVESAERSGTPVFAAMSAVDTLPVVGIDDHDDGADDHDDHDDGADDHDDHDDGADDHDDGADDHDDGADDHDDHDDGADDHDDDDDDGADDHDEHGHGDGLDPHFFTDPARMAVVADAVAEFVLANVTGADTDAVMRSVEAYVAELEALDAEVAETLAAIPSDQRILVTNHSVFGYFADRYNFEVIGAVLPGGSTANGADAQRLVELAETIEHEGVPAIFADSSSSDELAQTLAAEVGDVSVVELFSESLGGEGSDGSSYIAMLGANARRIADALAN